jgi:hypothetical protein
MAYEKNGVYFVEINVPSNFEEQRFDFILKETAQLNIDSAS